MSDKNGTPTFESKVNEVITNTTKDDAGKLVLPEGTDEATAFAVRSEIRRRDTQASYTKGQQRLKALEVENDKLAASWESDAVSNLSSTEQAKLEELKVQDPEAWRAEISNLEEVKRGKFKEKRAEISKEASQMTELERRSAQLEQFNTDNPTLVITDDVIQNDIPPRITKKLEAGEIQFDEYLTEVKNYLSKNKVIDKGDGTPNEPDFKNARGSSAPSKEAVAQQNSTDYTKEIF